MFLHPYAEIFPAMSDEELKELRTDLAKRGLLDPITTYQGKVLDGRNRQDLCRELGIAMKAVEFKGTDEDALNFVMSKNLHRRQLSSGQKAMIAQEYLKHFEALAKERQKAAGGDKVSPEVKAERPLNQKIDEAVLKPAKPASKPKPAPQAIEQAAKAVGTNKQYVADAKKVKQADPALAEEVKQGKVTLPQAVKQVKASEPPKPPRARKPDAKRFDPERRWQKHTMPLLAQEIGKWPKSFQSILVGYLREWATTIENMN